MCPSFKCIIIHKKAKNWENAQTVSLNYSLKARLSRVISTVGLKL